MKTPVCGKCEGMGDTWNEWVCSQCSSDLHESLISFDKRKWENRKKRIMIRRERRPAHSEYKWVATMGVGYLGSEAKVWPYRSPNGVFIGRGNTVQEAVAALRKEWKEELRDYISGARRANQ